MQLKINVCLLFIFMLTTNFTQAKSLNEIIPVGFEIRDSVSGNLNDDKYQDMILVLKRIGEDSLSLTSDFAIKREALILYGDEQGYTVIARNMNVVSCCTCGGVLGDPYVGVTIENQTFSVSHYGGGVWRWGRVSTFGKNTTGTWVLITDENETFNAVNQIETTENTVTTPKEFGIITFQQYDFDKE